MKRPFLFFSLLIALGSAAQAQHATFDTKPYIEATGAQLEFVATGDVNGDGLTDVVGATDYGFSNPKKNSTFVWLQDNNGKLKSPLIVPIPYSVIGCLTVSDLYKDGSAEIIAGFGAYTYIYAFSNNTLVLTDSLNTGGQRQDAVITGDFDNDGFTDIGISHWGGSRITVIYQNGEASAKWDMRQYSIPTDGYSHVTAGKFGSLPHTALIHTNGQYSFVTTVMLFDSLRTMQNKYELKITPGYLSTKQSSTVVVSKGPGQPHELWATLESNSPNSGLAIWRGLQTAPDSVFTTYDIPSAIQSANLDCDDDDEPVILHDAWNKITVVTDTQTKYQTPHIQNLNQEALSLGDVNNDGKIDVCLAADAYGLVILYNNTIPCGTTGLSDVLATTKELTIYPNPAQQNTTITFNCKGQLLITDAQGRSVHNTSFNQKATVDISSWATGIYFSILRTEDGQVLTKKLLKD